MLYSMKPWFFWNRAGIVFYALIVVFLLARIPFFSIKLKKRQFINCCLCLFMYTSISILDFSCFSSVIQYFFRYLFLVFAVILFTDKEKILLVNTFTKVYSIVLFVSVIFYVLYLLDINIPYTILKYESNTGYPEFKNYIFLIVPNQFELFYRFQSIFLEPGHVGVISSLILYLNRYDLRRKSVLIIFVSVVISFSLAAYMLLIFGYLLYFVMKGVYVFRKLLLITTILSSIVVFSLVFYVNNPDSVYSKLIVSRLEYNEDRGLAGNNRTTDQFDHYYDNVFWGKQNMFFGIGGDDFYEKFGWGNSSFKTFIVVDGIVSLLFLILFYFYVLYSDYSSLYMGLFLLYIASFMQRPYALWEVELFLFMSAGSVFKFPDKDFVFK